MLIRKHLPQGMLYKKQRREDSNNFKTYQTFFLFLWQNPDTVAV